MDYSKVVKNNCKGEKKMKKFMMKLLRCFMLVLGIMGATGVVVHAKSSDAFPNVSTGCYIKGYCYRVHETTGNKVYVYANEDCTNRNAREYISAKTDECYIVQTSNRTNNVKVSYPTSTGRKYRWTVMETFTSKDSYSLKYATASIPAYKFASSSYRYGSISKNDPVRLYESCNGYTRVLYPVSNGYKLAWISDSNVNKYLRSSETTNYASISEGTYKIATALNDTYVLDVNNYAKFNGGNVEIYPYHGTANEKWKITSVGNGYYVIIDTNSGKALDVSGGGTASQTNVQIWESNNTQAQKWRFISAGNGYYYIVNAGGCYLDVQNGTVQNGNNVWVYTKNNTNAQKWKLTGVSESNPVNNSTTLASPVPTGAKFNKKTSDSGWYGYHDINRGVYVGMPVYAITDGTISCYQAYRTYSGTKYLTSYGNFIEFTSRDGVYKAKYCHLNGFNNVSLNIPSSRTKRVSGSNGKIKLSTRYVSKGELIGYIGTTGNSSGAHLHFELRKNGMRIDPTSVINGLV